MSVQLSVVIWTVINFCILMLVLWKLLFKPTLAFMDKRAEKIRRVRDEKAELEAASAAEAAKAAAESAGKKEREAAAKAAARDLSSKRTNPPPCPATTTRHCSSLAAGTADRFLRPSPSRMPEEISVCRTRTTSPASFSPSASAPRIPMP